MNLLYLAKLDLSIDDLVCVMMDATRSSEIAGRLDPTACRADSSAMYDISAQEYPDVRSAKWS